MPWEKEFQQFLVAHLCCGSDTRQKLGSEMASAALQGSSAKRLASKETLSSATARQQDESPKSCIDVGATPKTQVDEVPVRRVRFAEEVVAEMVEKKAAEDEEKDVVAEKDGNVQEEKVEVVEEKEEEEEEAAAEAEEGETLSLEETVAEEECEQLRLQLQSMSPSELEGILEEMELPLGGSREEVISRVVEAYLANEAYLAQEAAAAAAAAEAAVLFLRPRSRGGLGPQAAAWLHSQLMALGKAANARSRHFAALAWFECAYELQAGAESLISAVNMRLRLGQARLAQCLYAHALRELSLTTAQQELVTRKLAEAEAALLVATAPPPAATAAAAEVAELLDEEAAEAPAAKDMGEMVPLLRAQGLRANKLGDAAAARAWFDAAFLLSRLPSDLLSAANMRHKLEAASPAAEALYSHLLAVPCQDERTVAMAARKLADVHAQQQQQAGALSRSRATVTTQADSGFSWA